MKKEFKEFDRVIVRNRDDEKWKASVFVGYGDDDEYPYECLNDCWRMCVPYYGNECIIGTTDGPETAVPKHGRQPMAGDTVYFPVFNRHDMAFATAERKFSRSTHDMEAWQNGMLFRYKGQCTDLCERMNSVISDFINL